MDDDYVRFSTDASDLKKGLLIQKYKVRFEEVLEKGQVPTATFLPSPELSLAVVDDDPLALYFSTKELDVLAVPTGAMVGLSLSQLGLRSEVAGKRRLSAAIRTRLALNAL